MKQFIEDFKKFALKGNVLDMAIGVIVGNAFSKIVSSLVNDIIMPLFACVTGSNTFADVKILLVENGEASTYLFIGQFIQNIIDFLIIALSLFIFIKVVTALVKKKEEAPVAVVKKSDELLVMEEIRDLLKSK